MSALVWRRNSVGPATHSGAGWPPAVAPAVSASALLSLALALLPATLSAQSLGGGQFTLNGGPVTGGGGKSDGGKFAVAGGAGETATGPLTGGTFQVTGGLVGVAVVPSDFALTVGHTDDGQVRIEWPAEATGYVLEFTPTIGEFANWQPVTTTPTGHTFITPFSQPLRFFRLHKP